MPASIDPFAAWVVSAVGVELPLSVEQQALLVAVLGIYVLFSLLLLLLLFLYGVGTCWESTIGRCCRSASGDGMEFLVLDEKTDLEKASFKALAKAELIDGTPRLSSSPMYDYYGSGSPQSYFDGSPSQGTLAGFATPGQAASGRSARGPFEPAPATRSALTGRSLPDPQAPACVPTGAPSVTTRFVDPAGVPSPKPPYGAVHADCFYDMQRSEGRFAARASTRSSAPSTPPLDVPAVAPQARAGSPFAAQTSGCGGCCGSARAASPVLSSRRGTPRTREVVGDNRWDKDSPAWYGV